MKRDKRWMDLIEKVRKDFAYLKDRYFALLIFGSQAKGYSVPGSDIDVCIVAKEAARVANCYHEIYPHVRMDLYDVVIFEHCDDDLKSEIARNHFIVYCKDEEGLERYLDVYKSRAINLRALAEIGVELRAVVDAL
jgi:predicted nucleotidyltransferase